MNKIEITNRKMAKILELFLGFPRVTMNGWRLCVFYFESSISPVDRENITLMLNHRKGSTYMQIDHIDSLILVCCIYDCQNWATMKQRIKSWRKSLFMCQISLNSALDRKWFTLVLMQTIA